MVNFNIGTKNEIIYVKFLKASYSWIIHLAFPYLLQIQTIYYLYSAGGAGVGGGPFFFLHISSSWVEINLHTTFQLTMLQVIGQTVLVAGRW